MTSFVDQVGAEALRLFFDGHLVLFDAKSDNQCHLVALKIATLYKKKSVLTEKEKRFIVLSFILSSTFCFNETVFNELAKTTISATTLQSHRRELYEEMNDLILADTSSKLEEQPSESELGAILLDASIRPFPKLAGVEVFLYHLGSHPLILKIKVLCPRGIHLESYAAANKSMPFKPIEEVTGLEEEPAIVIEAIAAISKDVFETSKSLHRRCTHSLFHHVKIGKGHQCLLCRPCEGGCSYSKEDRQRKIQELSIEQIFHLAGADFMRFDRTQREFRLDSYPIFSERLHTFQEMARDKGLSEEEPSLLLIQHVFADLSEHATRVAMRHVDRTPQEIDEEIGGSHA